MFDERFFLRPRVPQNAMIRDPLHGLLRYDSCRVPFPLLSKGEQRTGRTFFVVVETFHREITSSPRPTNRPRPRPRWNPVVTVLSSEYRGPLSSPCRDKLLEDRETLEDADRVLMQRKKRGGGRRKCGFTCSRKLGRRWIHCSNVDCET